MALPNEDVEASAVDDRVDWKFKIEVSDETFSFETIQFRDPIVTAAQIAESVGAHPVPQFKILQQLSSGEIETKRPAETTDLREIGIERFFVIRSDRSFDFTVDGLAMEWPLGSIVGKHLRELARASEHQELVRVTAVGFQPVDDDETVSFEEPESEEFRLVDRLRTVTIFYREEPFEVEHRQWATEELAALFEVPAGYKLDLIEASGEFKEMKPGHKVKVRNGMEFTSHVPSGQSS